MQTNIINEAHRLLDENSVRNVRIEFEVFSIEYYRKKTWETEREGRA